MNPVPVFRILCLLAVLQLPLLQLAAYAQQPAPQADPGTASSAMARAAQHVPYKAGRLGYMPIDTLALPFFDSFSGTGVHPSGQRWYSPGAVHLNRTSGLNVPGAGQAAFNGVGPNNVPYATGAGSYYADSLQTHYIDLSGHTPADSIYLSFRIQPGGKGDIPESWDSLTIFFRDTTYFTDTLYNTYSKTVNEAQWNYDPSRCDPKFAGQDSCGYYLEYVKREIVYNDTLVRFNPRWIQVYAIRTDTVASVDTTFFGLETPDSSRFYRVMIPVRDSAFFHLRFQVLFLNHATLSGNYDLWLLDDVYIAAGRHRNDTTRTDVAIQYGTMRAEPYATAIPRRHWQATASTLVYSAGIVNESNTATGTQRLRTQLAELVGGTYYGGSQYGGALAPLASMPLAMDGDNPDVSLDTNYVFRNLLTLRPSSANPVPAANDSLELTFRIDSLLAYDDGESEYGFGARAARSFGQLFNAFVPDSLTAVWLAFSPKEGVSEQTGFDLRVWKKSSAGIYEPDSTEISQFALVRYDTVPNTFFRYPLAEKIAVDGEFMVGLRQYDNQNIGLGLDVSYTGATQLWDSAGIFYQLPAYGALMIRPEFDSGALLITSTADPARMTMQLYPNPVVPGGVVYLQPGIAGSQLQQVQLYSASGQLAAEPTPVYAQGHWQVPLPTGTAQGLYLLRTTWAAATGQAVLAQPLLVTE